MSDESDTDAKTTVSELIAQLEKLAAVKPATIDALRTLLDPSALASIIRDGVAAILPSRIRGDLWNGWLEGSLTVPREIAATDPNSGKRPGPSGRQMMAQRAHDAAQEKLRRIRAALIDAEAEARDAAAALADADEYLRLDFLYRFTTSLVDALIGGWALGPQYTLLRACSRYLQRDPTYEAGLDEFERIGYEEHRKDRTRTAAKIAELLDLYCGDIDLEFKLHEILLMTLEGHHEPVAAEIARRNEPGFKLSSRAKRVKRRADDRRGSIRTGAKMSDRHEVLAGLDLKISGEFYGWDDADD